KPSKTTHKSWLKTFEAHVKSKQQFFNIRELHTNNHYNGVENHRAPLLNLEENACKLPRVRLYFHSTTPHQHHRIPDAQANKIEDKHNSDSFLLKECEKKSAYIRYKQ